MHSAISLLFLIAVVFLYLERRRSRLGEPFPWVYYLFFFSGFPALLYQIVWERALFALYGINIESVTIVVTGFMLGLGLGSLAGGRISRIPRIPILAIFGLAELATAVFGFFSLTLFHQVALYTAGISALDTGLISFALLLLPTMLMGSTLPLLVAHTVRLSGNVGRSLGMLYFVNTAGSALACFVAAFATMRLLGESGSTELAASFNAAVGACVLLLFLSQKSQRLAAEADPNPGSIEERHSAGLVKLSAAAIFVAITGFIALAYEIIWYRVFSFWSGSNARVFACLLGAYLAGIAIGGLLAHALTSRGERTRDSGEYLRLISCFVIVANLVGFVVAPALAVTAVDYSPAWILLIIAVAAAFLAATFPLICHISLEKDSRTGSRLGILYFSNIVGSALGSFLVGFVLMNIWGVRQLSVFLALLGMGLALALLMASGPRKKQLVTALAGVMVVGAGVVVLAHPLFDGLYEKLMFKRSYHPGERFRHVVENRSGVITVTADATVYGGGMYDGRFNTDLVHDINGVFRVYALSSFHPMPRNVLMIGLSSGSWAQIVANHPQVETLTIVEINPGYLQLVAQYPQVAGLLANPKAHVVTDDGRRWLMSHPDRKFDVIVMNTSFNWREHMSNLLSVEFLQLARRHLLPGGVLYYNTTGSQEVLFTGTMVFPYGLRVGNFLAVSDSPMVVNRERLRWILLQYRIDDLPVLNMSIPDDAKRLREMLDLTQRFGSDRSFATPSMEYADSIRERCRGKRIITDDNMGTEWTW
jgi:spermidine synthase